MGQDENVPSTGTASNTQRSYDLDQLDRRAEEVRLTTQAEVALALELEHISRVGIPPDATVLDVGCGPGLLSAPLAGMVPQGRRSTTTQLLEPREHARPARVGTTPPSSRPGPTTSPLPTATATSYARFLFQHLPPGGRGGNSA